MSEIRWYEVVEHVREPGQDDGSDVWTTQRRITGTRQKSVVVPADADEDVLALAREQITAALMMSSD